MKKTKIGLLIIGVLLLVAGILSAQLTSIQAVIEINPNPMDKFTTIDVRMTHNTNIGVNIETDTGVVIKTLYWGPGGESTVLYWDRSGDNGNYTPAGKYYVVVNYSSRYTSTKKTLILR
ncbi:MAG: hypothetical protein Q8M98_11295 [Candidatus Cloacimonadaceae bacterium]|nr:hypothetical protein [Candidatus Cloacimonadaceae bacterium]MDP3115338.1 hypothetical protein [Candidatus Cloacimonadaceae bacterium]